MRKAERQYARLLYRDGKTDKEIAFALYRPKQAIRQWRQNAGLRENGGRGPMRKADRGRYKYD